VLAIFSVRDDDASRIEANWWANPGSLPARVLDGGSPVNETRADCDLFSCFNIYKCGRSSLGHDRLSVHVYPYRTFLLPDGSPVSEGLTKEYWEFLTAVRDSGYFTSDPSEACVFVPSIDVSNEYRVRPYETGQALASLPL
jgi:glucuronyl/N-acetylglucosaminyl transferase EXT2